MNLIEKLIENRNMYWKEHAEAKQDRREHFWSMYVKYRDMLEYLQSNELYLCVHCTYEKHRCLSARRPWIVRTECLTCDSDKRSRRAEILEFQSAYG